MGQEVFVRGLTRRKTRVDANDSMGTAAARIDLADGPTRRIFSNKSTTAVVLPDVHAVLQKPGTLATQSTTSGMVFRAPRAMKVWGVAAQAGTAPGGTALLTLDVHKAASATAAGTTIFTDQARRPAFAAAAGNTVLGGTANMGYPGTGSTYTVDLAAGDYLRVEVDVVGNATAGADLAVQIFGY